MHKKNWHHQSMYIMTSVRKKCSSFQTFDNDDTEAQVNPTQHFQLGQCPLEAFKQR